MYMGNWHLWIFFALAIYMCGRFIFFPEKIVTWAKSQTGIRSFNILVMIADTSNGQTYVRIVGLIMLGLNAYVACKIFC